MGQYRLGVGLCIALWIVSSLCWAGNRPLTIVVNPGVAPLKFMDDSGVPQGLFPDLWRLWAEKTGTQIQLIPADNFDQSLDMVKNGKADLHAGLFQTEDRKAFFSFSEPILTLDYFIFTHPGIKPITRIQDCQGLILGIQKGGYTEAWVRSRIPSAQIAVYDSFGDLFAAARKGEVKVFIATRLSLFYWLNQNRLANVFTADEKKPIYSQTYYAAAARSDSGLIDQVNAGLEAISQDERDRVEKAWIVRSVKTAPENLSVLLTREEQEFVSSHPPLVFSEVNWKPLSIVTDGRFEGMIADYLDMITQRSGLKFTFRPSRTWADVLDAYAKGTLDMIPALGRDDAVGREILLSEPFLTFPLVIVTQGNVSYISDTRELSGKKVSVGRGYTSYHYLAGHYPEIELVQADDVDQALLQVTKGQVYAFVGHMAVTIDALQRLGLKNLKIAGETDYRFEHRIGVDPRYPEALSLINKAIASMDVQDHRRINQKWLNVNYQKGMDYSLIWKLAAVSALCFGVFLFWNRKLAKLNRILNLEIMERQKADDLRKETERRLGDIIDFLPDPTLVIDNQGTVVAWNRAMETLTGIGAANILGKGDYEYALPFYGKRRPILIDLVNRWDDDIAREYLSINTHGENLISESFHSLLAGGIYLSATARSLYDNSGNLTGAIESLRDVTERRRTEERFQSIAANIPGAIFQAKLLEGGKLLFTYVSPAMKDHFNITVEDLVKRQIPLEFHPDDAPRFQEILNQVSQSGEDLNFTGKLATHGKETRWIRIAAKNSTGDEGLVYNGLILDVTRRKLAELEYLTTERKIMAMSKAVDDALIMVDSRGGVLFWNDAAETLFGFTAQEAIGRPYHDLAAPPEDLETISRGMAEFARTGKGVVFGSRMKVTARNRDGKRFPVEVSISPFQVDNEWFAVGTVRDIADRVRAEKEIAQHVEGLERFNRLVVGREEKMIQLKTEINQLLEDMGKPKKYTIVQ
ncbi:MAG: transporter substrate-binding domain-containing protein [Pseudomonadota bacterium]